MQKISLFAQVFAVLSRISSSPTLFQRRFFPLAGSSIIALANYAGVLAYFPKEEGITSRRSFSFQKTS